MIYRTVIMAMLMGISMPALSDNAQLVIGDGIELGDSQQVLVSKLQSLCQEIALIDTDMPSYPLASQTEKHLLCSDYSRDTIQFSKAIFVIADDKFVHMEAQWNDADALIDKLGEKAGNYIGMDVYGGGSYWVNSSSTSLIWLSKEAMHPNLFAWSNPLLTSSAQAEYASSSKIPDILNFSSDIETLLPLFAEQCKYVREDNIESVWLPNGPKQQIQINCFGYEFAGFERKFEAVFGDGKLQVVWVLSGKQEEARIREILVSDWGDAEIVNQKWEVFANGRMSLRKDKPEMLILSDEMIPFYQKDFNQN